MPLWMDILIAVLAVIGFVFIRSRFKENKKIRTVSLIALIVILILTSLYAAATYLLVYREDDIHPEPRDEIQELAAMRVEQRIRDALDYIERYPSSETSMKAFPFEEERNEGKQNLNEEQMKIYNELKEKELSLQSFSYSAEEYGYPYLDNLLVASYALGNDHPVTDSYISIKEVFEGEKTTAMASRYFMPQDPEMTEITTEQQFEELKKELQILDAEIQMIVDAIPAEKSVYDRYRYLATYISLTTRYDHDGEGGMMTSTPYGGIEGGLSICQGYSKAFEVLCERAGLYCKCVTGVSDGVSHMWNLIQLEDGTYHVDITWSDDGYNLPDESGWYQYFALPQETILQLRHEITDGTVATGTRQIIPPHLK